jgi:hypothetical protein
MSGTRPILSVAVASLLWVGMPSALAGEADLIAARSYCN